MTEIVVTGLGATTPLGGNVAETWEKLIAGQSGVRALDFDWVEDMPSKIGATLAVDPSEVIPRVRLRRLDRSEQLALISSSEAWEDAGLGEDTDRDRLAVVFGSGIGGVQTTLDQDDILEEKGPRRVSPFTVPMLMPNGPAAWVGLEYKARAGVHAPTSACATSAESIAWAADIIRSGRADVVVAGGTEAVIAALPYAGFTSMKAMSTRNDEPEKASRPWDRDRDGFVMGEGSAALILETREHAEARGARIYAVLGGAGLTSDGYDIVAPAPNGEGGKRAMAMAIEQAGIAPSEIGHVNCHATSTPVGDMAEVKAIGELIGKDVLLTSTKSMTGHLLGGAGALESIAAILAIHHSLIPPTINLDNPDDELDLEVVSGEARKTELTAALNNSFGFGGHNAALLFQKYSGKG
ncbi:beta-ketoacyl-ACP synthase II [Salininema proteolyticum]|uniref:3-oxoacyl-[acyl-carrier-protein] synthase 2 n=1 Tax=Salininema proteolyticum TaxID=1607685 RepID=A0ABV8TVG3_9ACTN